MRTAWLDGCRWSRPRLGWMDGVIVALAAEGCWWNLRDNARKIEVVDAHGAYVDD